MMRKTLLVAALLAPLAVNASPFPLKGIDTGMTIEDVKKMQPMACHKWMEEPISTSCYADKSFLLDKFKTLGEQQVEEIRVLHDKNGIVHSVLFKMECDDQVLSLELALSGKFGDAKSHSRDPYRAEWKKAGNELDLSAGYGKKSHCYSVSNHDKAFSDFVAYRIKHPPKPQAPKSSGDL